MAECVLNGRLAERLAALAVMRGIDMFCVWIVTALAIARPQPSGAFPGVTLPGNIYVGDCG